MTLIKAQRIVIRGIVQGVGFRPFLFREATRRGLCGTIQNHGAFVQAQLEGDVSALDGLVEEIRRNPPPQAKVEFLGREEIALSGAKELQIVTSQPRTPGEAGESDDLNIPLDLVTCEECFKEFHDPRDRRYGYPFLSCTSCGPRYSAIKSLPYDRKSTSMQPFPLCAECLAEYRSPENRRFHAEMMACPHCGPKLELERWDQVPDTREERSAFDIQTEVHELLKKGKLLAVQGIGGFQLVCNAQDRAAIELLRFRKKRPHQSLAVMARDLESIRAVCEVSQADARLLSSPSAPILILPRKKIMLDDSIPFDLICPDHDSLGVMLPTSPTHELLFGKDGARFALLIVTSGNAHGEPLARTLKEARTSLKGIADAVLFHGREILRRCDDSVWVADKTGEHQVWRLGRGEAPRPLLLSNPMPDSGKVVLALGGELKNTIAMGLGAKILISPHHGNLSLYSAFKAFEEQVSAFSKLLRHRPQVVAIDQHPQYANSEWGRKYANENGLELIEVQHHHAHAVSCMAEHGLTESLALVFDGMGYFNDPGSGESLWGGELLHANLHGFERVGTFSQALLPGGDRAVRQPWRQAVARLLASGVLLKNYPNLLEKLKVNPQELLSLEEMLNKVPGIWKTSSVGRVFDSVAAMMGICEKELSYEGQAAIRLEKLARQAEMDTPIVSYPFEIQERDGIPHVELHGMISRLAEELAWNPATPQMALKFHDTIICASRELVAHAAEKTGLKDIVLSGGVFQNQLLVARMIPEIQSLGLKVYTHQRIPPNDGGLALGQAVIAMKLSGI